MLPVLLCAFAGGCSQPGNKADWTVSVLPPSVRLDPVNNEIIEHRFDEVEGLEFKDRDLLEKNWIFDGERVSLHGARGEYISFQVVITNQRDTPMKGVRIGVTPFRKGDSRLGPDPELFLEWAVEIKETSTGYPLATLGKGWYPDALIPFRYIQADSAKVEHRWTYPVEIPDFNNRIDDQVSMIVWVDQYIPFEYEKAEPGSYSATIRVWMGDQQREIPVEFNIWDFAIPNENLLKASLQHEGFLSRKDEKAELEIYQLFKRNRMGLMDPTYKPDLHFTDHGEIEVDWDEFDRRLERYFTGEAFTAEYGYEYGPGYGEPVETFILPFNVYGKHGQRGWPDTGDAEVERNPENSSRYIAVIREVREHLLPIIDPMKTELTVYLNGLDESYFPEAWDRMVYYGDIFKQEYPEARFRVDGGYSGEAMEVIQHSIQSWASHTINYDIETISKYQEMGIEDWIYGPMLYEARVNSWSGSSTFIDLPLVNDRAISWSVWKYNAYSWIGWGVGAGWTAAWYDPETWKDTYKHGSDSDEGYFYKKLNGNGMSIYGPGVVPNVDGPCPSIRLKTFRNGVQEYEYLRLLSQLDGNEERADSIVSTIIKRPFGEKSIGNLDVWSFDPEAWDQARIRLGELIMEKSRAR